MQSNHGTSGLINPFNMTDRKEMEAMFESNPPDGTVMVMFLVGDTSMTFEEFESHRGTSTLACWEDCDLADFAFILKPVVEACIESSRFPQLIYESMAMDPCEDHFSSLDWVPLNHAQSRWAIDKKLRLQIGFYDLEHIQDFPDPTPAIYTAMTVYDRMYSKTGIINPCDQAPATADPTFKRAFQSFVNDVYKYRFGVWCRSLANLRNEVMVKTRATLHGADPNAEWKRFCDAGMVHFLDYLKIWQPPER